MKNSEQPAFPMAPAIMGLTKREQACITMRIPLTDDPELNKLIEIAQRRDIAQSAMQGMLSACRGYDNNGLDNLAKCAVSAADSLLTELDKTK